MGPLEQSTVVLTIVLYVVAALALIPSANFFRRRSSKEHRAVAIMLWLVAGSMLLAVIRDLVFLVGLPPLVRRGFGLIVGVVLLFGSLRLGRAVGTIRLWGNGT